MPVVLDDLMKLSTVEKLDLIKKLRDSLDDEAEDDSIPEWLIPELDRRKAALDANPESALTWEEVVRRVKARHAS